MQALVPAVSKAATEIISASQEAKILDSTAKAKLEINGLTNKYRLENQSNPEANFDKFKAERDKILSNYSKDISPLFRQQWIKQEFDIKAQTDASHQAWAIQQNASNAEFNLKQAMQSNYDLSFVDGQNFATGNDFDLSAALKYKQSYDQISQGAIKYLGEETTRQMMGNYEKNYMKSFLMGSIQSNPAKAMQLLNNPEVMKMLGASKQAQIKEGLQGKIEADQRKAEIEKRKAELEQLDAQSKTIVENIDGMDLTPEQKQLEINKRVLSGEVSDKVAATANKIFSLQGKIAEQEQAQSEHQQLVAFAQSRQKQIDIESLQNNNAIGGNLFDLVNDTAKTQFEKMRAIDNALLQGQISDKFARTLQTTLTRQTAFNAQKNADAVSDLVLQISALNQREDIESQDYLVGISQIRDNIAMAQAQGHLTADDALIVNKELSSATVKKKEAAALIEQANTGEVFSLFDNENAMDTFKKNLPNEQSATVAFRDYFYATQGKDYGASKKKQIATAIIRAANKKTINDAVKTPSFLSEQEAEKANLPKGTKVLINGRYGVVE